MEHILQKLYMILKPLYNYNIKIHIFKSIILKLINKIHHIEIINENLINFCLFIVFIYKKTSIF